MGCWAAHTGFNSKTKENANTYSTKKVNEIISDPLFSSILGGNLITTENFGLKTDWEVSPVSWQTNDEFSISHSFLVVMHCIRAVLGKIVWNHV